MVTLAGVAGGVEVVAEAEGMVAVAETAVMAVAEVGTVAAATASDLKTHQEEMEASESVAEVRSLLRLVLVAAGATGPAMATAAVVGTEKPSVARLAVARDGFPPCAHTAQGAPPCPTPTYCRVPLGRRGSSWSAVRALSPGTQTKRRLSVPVGRCLCRQSSHVTRNPGRIEGTPCPPQLLCRRPRQEGSACTRRSRPAVQHADRRT